MESNTPESTVQVLSTAAQLAVPHHADAGALWLSAAKLHELTGWQLKPEGLCKDDTCVPLPKGEEPIIEAGRVCASRLWERLERPMLHDAARSVWFLGEDAQDRPRQTVAHSRQSAPGLRERRWRAARRARRVLDDRRSCCRPQ